MLFTVGAKYSAIYGSKYGKGYVVDVNMATLINAPEKGLYVDLDGNVYKIDGDLNLGFI